jgi:hypothetical protein
VEQPREAERALQRVLEVVIAGVDGLVVGEASGETLPGPLEGARDTGGITGGEQALINRADLGLDFVRLSRIDVGEHRRCPGFYRFRQRLASRRNTDGDA